MDDPITTGVTEGFGLMYYNARYYSPCIMQFNQPDTLIPDTYDTQSWNRYSYVRNNPVNFSDPSGHKECDYKCQIEYEGADSAYEHYGEGTDWDVAKQRKNEKIAETILYGGSEVVASVVFEPADWAFTAYHCANGDCSPWMLLGMAPLIPSSVGSHADDIVDAGYGTFRQLKNVLGDAGEGMEWHHIVEQSQIAKSGFSPQQIHNLDNVIAINKTVHRQISGFYSSKPLFADGLRVRDWLAGKSFSAQYEYGIKILRDFGVIP